MKAPRLSTIVVLVVVSSALHVLIAWGCAQRSGRLVDTPVYMHDHQRIWSTRRDDDWPVWARGAERSVSLGRTTIQLGAAKPSPPAADGTGRVNDFGATYRQTEVGWPLRCLRKRSRSVRLFDLPRDRWPALAVRSGLEATTAYPRFEEHHGVFDLEDVLPWELPDPRLPIEPIWPGLLVNVVATTAALWLVVAVVAESRRALRHARRRCMRCGYRLGEDVDPCPECGEPMGPSPLRPTAEVWETW